MPKLSWEPGALLAPVPPTLVSCGSAEAPKVLTVAWAGIINTRPAMTYVSIRPERHSYGTIKASGEFTINLPTTALVHAVDYCGVRSGAVVDKFAATGLTPLPGVSITAPHIAQCPISLECSVCNILELGSHHMFMADIKKVLVDEAALDRCGRLMIERLSLLAYAHGSYFSLGEQLGTFGYSVRKKPTRRPPARRAQNKESKVE